MNKLDVIRSVGVYVQHGHAFFERRRCYRGSKDYRRKHSELFHIERNKMSKSKNL